MVVDYPSLRLHTIEHMCDLSEPAELPQYNIIWAAGEKANLADFIASIPGFHSLLYMTTL